MSEKRFTVDKIGIFDNQEKKHFEFTAYDWVGCDIYECCGLLNEQQATISKQLDQIIELQDKYRILEFNHRRLEKRNKKQYEKIGEQQDTIQSLQDLCGKSDYENAKLRIENKKLQKKVNWLCETFNYGSDESIKKSIKKVENPSSSSTEK